MSQPDAHGSTDLRIANTPGLLPLCTVWCNKMVEIGGVKVANTARANEKHVISACWPNK